MSDDPAPASSGEVLIHARGVGKRFRIYGNPNARLVEWATMGRRRLHEGFWAVDGVDVTIRRGDCLGLVGRNGSGKSTLLRMLSGAMRPSRGTVRTRGRVFALIELGTGFDRNLTGRRNIEVVGQMLGLPPGYTRERMKQIIEFSELGPFIDKPARMYSSGMFSRLAFSVFAFLDPDVLMIDEVLAVGDQTFKQKCLDLIEEDLVGGNRAVVYVSHNLPSVARVCSRVIWLHRGQVMMRGDPNAVINGYVDYFGTDLSRASRQSAQARVERDPERAMIPASNLLFSASSEPARLGGNGSSRGMADAGAGSGPGGPIRAMWLENALGDPLTAGRTHQPFTVCLALDMRKIDPEAVWVLTLTAGDTDEPGEPIGATTIEPVEAATEAGLAGHGLVVARLGLTAGLGPGRYRLDLVSRREGVDTPLLDDSAVRTVDVLGPARVPARLSCFKKASLAGSGELD